MVVLAMNSEFSARRRTVRRQQERRTNPYPFNSKEWIAFIQQQYLLWPKYERRVGERRVAERRETDRRAALRKESEEVIFQRTRWFSAETILNDDVKQMIQELFAEEE